MSEAVVTDADRERAAAALNYGPTEQVSPMDGEYVEQIAAALAAEREKARAPFLALAERYEATVIRRYALAAKFMEAGRWQLSDGFRSLARQATTAADRIRRAAEETAE